MVGPLLLTTLVITWGTPGWLLLGGLFLAAGLAMTPAVRWAECRRATVAPAAGGLDEPNVAGAEAY